MKHNIIWIAAVCVLELAAGPTARAGFILMEDFEDVALNGNLGDVNAGESFGLAIETGQSPSAIVAAAPWDPSGRAAKVTTRGAALFMPASIPNGSTGTLFYQIYRETGLVNLSAGMSDETSPAFNFGHFESQMNINKDPAPQVFRARNGAATADSATSFDAGAVYNVWHVIDNSDNANPQGNDTTKIYIQKVGVDPAPVQMVVGGVSEFAFRNGTTSNDLVHFLFMTAGNGAGVAAHTTVYFDNVFLDSAGGDLSNPVPEPSTLVLFVGGLSGLAWYGWRRRKA